MTNGLQYEVRTERRQGPTRDLPAGNEEWRWVANTSTLIWGENDAVLVDTFTTLEQNARLIDWVRAHGKTLTAVYLTHGHGDHAFGVGQLRTAFPTARILSTPGTLAQLRVQARPEYRDDFWGRLFPGQIPTIEFPAALETVALTLKGTRSASSRRATPTLRAPHPCGCPTSVSSLPAMWCTARPTPTSLRPPQTSD